MAEEELFKTNEDLVDYLDIFKRNIPELVEDFEIKNPKRIEKIISFFRKSIQLMNMI